MKPGASSASSWLLRPLTVDEVGIIDALALVMWDQTGAPYAPAFRMRPLMFPYESWGISTALRDEVVRERTRRAGIIHDAMQGYDAMRRADMVALACSRLDALGDDAPSSPKASIVRQSAAPLLDWESLRSIVVVQPEPTGVVPPGWVLWADDPACVGRLAVERQLFRPFRLVDGERPCTCLRWDAGRWRTPHRVPVVLHRRMHSWMEDFIAWNIRRGP